MTSRAGPHLEGRPALPTYPGHDHDRPLDRDDDTRLEPIAGRRTAGALAVRPGGRLVVLELDEVLERFDLTP